LAIRQTHNKNLIKDYKDSSNDNFNHNSKKLITHTLGSGHVYGGEKRGRGIDLSETDETTIEEQEGMARQGRRDGEKRRRGRSVRSRVVQANTRLYAKKSHFLCPKKTNFYVIIMFFQKKSFFQNKIKCKLHSICSPFYFFHNN